MNAFLSYSLEDTESPAVLFLSGYLSERGLNISSSGYTLSKDNTLPMESILRIQQATLFIGVASAKGKEQEKVFKEWEFANSIYVPSLLLVEDFLENKITDTLPKNHNIIVFNRKKPQQAIDEINQQIQITVPQKIEKPSDNAVLAWMFGGGALLQLVTYFSKK